MAKMICLILFLVKLNIMGSLGSGEMVSTPNPSDITRFRLIVCYIKTDLDNIKSQLQELTEQHTDFKEDLEIKELKLENELLKLKLQLSDDRDDVKAELESSKAKNIELEQQLSAMNGELENVRQQVAAQSSELREAKTSLSSLSNELNDTKALLRNTRAMSGELDSVRQQVTAQSSELREAKTSLSSLSSDVNEAKDLLRNTQVSPVAFAVRFPQSTSAGFAGRLIFIGVITNLGNNYDTSRGVFTCPVTGLYLFSYNVLSNDQRSGRSHISARLRVDSVDRWYAYSHNTGSDDMYMNAGGTVILQCSAGSQVEVYKWGSGDVYEYYQTWFTGFLIQPI